ncbi:MAG: hypothetical protein HYY06_13315 [Deltaproteobacteria bacterium]|nr:hypothetical protein [Deltaproteobacteria bacterium]
MPDLLLSERLAERFVRALLAVCRVDGEVTSDELVALRAEIQALPSTGSLDEEAVLQAEEVTPQDLAAAARGDGLVYRGVAQSPMPAVAEAFVAAALRVVTAASSLDPLVLAQIRAFAVALDCPAPALERVDGLFEASDGELDVPGPGAVDGE